MAQGLLMWGKWSKKGKRTVWVGSHLAACGYLPHLPQTIPCSYWALFCYANLPSFAALYAISVRQARVLPPSFFRFRLTTDTLDLGYILPAAGWIRVFHPLERALTGRTQQKDLSGWTGLFE